MPHDLVDVMKALYNSEINVSISCFWDGGWDVKLGDKMNGYKAEDNFYRVDEAASWLVNKAKKAYPNSEFAKLYR